MNSSSALANFSRSYSLEHVYLYSTIWFVSALGVFGNTVLLGAYVKYPQMRKSKFTHLIASLALTDLITNLGMFLVQSPSQVIIQLSRAAYIRKDCLAIASFPLIGLFSGQIVTISIAWDRVQAFSKPVFYKAKKQARYARRTLAFALSYSVVLTSLMWVMVELESIPKVCTFGATVARPYALYTVLFTITCSILVVSFYISSFYYMRRSCKAKFGMSKGAKAKKQALERQVKVMKTVSLILAIYIVCWVVPNVSYVLGLALKLPPNILGRLTPLIAIGSALNCSLNCAVYAVKNINIRCFMVAFVTGKSAASIEPQTGIKFDNVVSKRVTTYKKHNNQTGLNDTPV